MTITTTSASLIPAAPVFTNTERLALAGPNVKDLIARGWRARCPQTAGARLTSAAEPGGMRCCSPEISTGQRAL
jgi:hypothetical protein